MINIAKQPRNDSALMMYLTDQISRGYHYFLQGEINAQKIPSFETKMNAKYSLDLKVHQRSYRKRKGLPNYILVISQPKDGVCSWYILSAGTKTKVLKEGIKNDDIFHCALDKYTRLTYKKYETKRVTKPRDEGGGHRWSWYINSSEYKQLREGFIEASRSRSMHKLEHLCLINRNRPMFGGIRSQIGALFDLAQKEATRSHRKRAKETNGQQEIPEMLTKTLPFFAKKMTIFSKKDS
jgi:hypothetical protein